ncbi:hypothetical protein MY4824_008133 [Beauveria thailandica]
MSIKGSLGPRRCNVVLCVFVLGRERLAAVSFAV